MESLISTVTGPLGALVLSCAILWWLAGEILPVLKHYLENQNEKLGKLVDALEKTVDAHEEDRKVFTETIAGITQRLDKVEKDVDLIKDSVMSHRSRE